MLLPKSCIDTIESMDQKKTLYAFDYITFKNRQNL